MITSVRRAKESISLAQPPELATVAEDEETTDHVISAVSPRTLTEKDESGRTALHTMVRTIFVISHSSHGKEIKKV